MIFGGAALVVAVAALRRFGPALQQRAMEKCEQMLDHMPDEFPPKRMMHNIDEIREQNSRILHQLGEEEQGRTTLAASA
jgi:hypothetical protein